MQLFGELDVISFVRISQWNWISRVNRMDSKRKGSQVFNNNPQGSRLRGRPKTGGGIFYKQILINAKLQVGKICQKQGRLEEVHEGGGPHWSVVPSKKKKESEK
jgi:hypothetical protein